MINYVFIYIFHNFVKLLDSYSTDWKMAAFLLFFLIFRDFCGLSDLGVVGTVRRWLPLCKKRIIIYLPSSSASEPELRWRPPAPNFRSFKTIFFKCRNFLLDGDNNFVLLTQRIFVLALFASKSPILWSTTSLFIFLIILSNCWRLKNGSFSIYFS